MTLALDSKITALVLIDLQHGILGTPLQPNSADAVLKVSSKMAEAFRERHAKVVYVRVDLNNLMPLNCGSLAHGSKRRTVPRDCLRVGASGGVSGE